MIAAETVRAFAELFAGLDRAYGTGKGEWVKEPAGYEQYLDHLEGKGPGLGIAPLRDDGTVSFAAVDLDEPDFQAAREIQFMLPGTAWIERSRSGNAHVWCFFREPIEAWIPRGIMREAVAALGRPKVEVFPKQDRLRAGMVGNYINLPYHGDSRQVFDPVMPKEFMSVELFVTNVTRSLNDSGEWRKRARWLGVPSPEEREQARSHEFGTQPFLHVCAEHIIANRETNPIVEGHRATVFFNLAKQLSNCELFDHDEALQMMALVNDASPDPISEAELERMLHNAERGQFVSTGCDDPLFEPYASPDCPILNRRN